MSSHVSIPTRLQDTLQKTCGGYLACVEQFTALVPAKFASMYLPEIQKTFLDTHFGNPVFFAYTIALELFRFLLRHRDSDIMTMLETTVPPATLSSISIFATAVGKFHSEAWLH